MKKMLKIIGFILLVIFGLILLLAAKGALTPPGAGGLHRKGTTGSPIEAAYLKNGSHRTACFEQNVSGDHKKIEVWYPEDLSENSRARPLIVVLNGTGVKASRYRAQFEHFASRGFIVVGTEEEEAWDGDAAEASPAFMLSQNEDPSGIFYHRIDTENIGAMGHSRGGAGVFNAVTAHGHSALYKAAVSVSPTNERQALALGWHYELSGIRLPLLLPAGTVGDFEMKLVLPQEDMIEMYEKIPAPRAMARRNGCEHGEMLYSADGYATARFMWQLQGDAEAAKAFTGASPDGAGGADP